jgi:hypothetical protein
MESLLEMIELDIDESSELFFKVKIEGIDPAPTKIRLVCEAGEIAYMFDGHTTKDDGVIQFSIPSLKDKVNEGVYGSRVEVLVDNRYFAPVEFNINFKKSVSVVAESVQMAPAAQPRVTAAPIVVKKPSSLNQRPKVPEQRAVVQPVSPVSQPRRAVAAPQIVAPTLKERYVARVTENDAEIDEEGVESLRELARTFVRSRQR